jgi:hypothetical protein
MNNIIQLRPAERKQAKVRIGLMGVSGSGKTYSALLLAKGLCGDWSKIALIDSESGRGDLYSDLGKYNIITLTDPFTPERYIEAIHACEAAGMEVIIIDSTSHEWEGKGGCLESNEILAGAKYKGNTWAAWSETTPRHQKFLEAIIASPCHVISTLRSKADTIQTEDKKIKKVGLKEIQREGFEYEMTVSFSIEREGHYAIAGKDNTHLFDSKDPFVISEEDGKRIREWNMSGAIDTSAVKEAIFDELVRIGRKPKTKEEAEEFVKKFTKLDLAEENYEKILQKLSSIKLPEPKEFDGDIPIIEDNLLDEEIEAQLNSAEPGNKEVKKPAIKKGKKI